jgi:hypothetical protein
MKRLMATQVFLLAQIDKTIVNTVGIGGFAKVIDKRYDVIRVLEFKEFYFI